MPRICQERKFRDDLLAYARGLGCQSHDAEDLVHAVFLKALEKYGGEAFSLLSLPYLKVMVRNLHLDQKRTQRPDPEEEIDESVSESRERTKELEQYALLDRALKKHKYGYIVLEMEKRGLRRIKELAPFVNEKKGKLYKRYQKLVKDLQTEVLGEG